MVGVVEDQDVVVCILATIIRLYLYIASRSLMDFHVEQTWDTLGRALHDLRSTLATTHKTEHHHTHQQSKHTASVHASIIIIMPEEETPQEERRMVAFKVTPKEGVDPVALYETIKTQVTVEDEYKLQFDDTCKVEQGRISASFTIGIEADFDEVMEGIEALEDQVASQTITFQTALE